MGSWNNTCGLTGLPIREGDDVYVFPILESSTRSIFCYTTGLYRPSVLPFRAKYDDCGGGEECSGPGLEILMKGINQQLVEMEVGENRFHDIAVKRDEFDVNKFFEAVHEHRLMFKNPLHEYFKDSPESHKMYFTMICADILDRLLDEWEFDFYKPSAMKEDEIPDGFESDDYYIKNVSYSKLIDMVPDYLDALWEEFKGALKNIKDIEHPSGDAEKTKELQERIFRSALKEIFNKSYNEEKHMLDSIVSHMFGSGYADGGFTHISDLRVDIVTAYMQNPQDAYDLLSECLKGYMINSYMGHVRRVWLPVMHQGSQSECGKEHKLLGKLIQETAEDLGDE